MDKIEKAKTASKLDLVLFKRFKYLVLVQISKIDDLEAQISQIYDDNGVKLDDPERSKDGDETCDFIVDTHEKLAAYQKAASPSSHAAPDHSASDGNQDLAKAIANMSCPIKINMSCPSFYGNEKDKLAFKNWFAQYETIIKANKG